MNSREGCLAPASSPACGGTRVSNAGQSHAPNDSAFEWLTGGGETGARMREVDWSRTALGPIEQWPQSLKTAIGVVLASPVAIVMLWGPEGVMIYNDAYSVFAGGRHPQLLGSRVLEGWPEVADFNRRVMDVCLAGGTLSFRDQRLVLHRNGVPEDVWMDLSYGPIRDEHGAAVGVLAIVIETTGRVLAEQQVLQLNATLERQVHNLAELDRAKTSFFSNISHEFRTPLTLMLGPTEDALASPDRALTGQNLDIVYRNELRLLKLVNALLDFSRIEAGRMRPLYQATDLAAATSELASVFRRAVERAGLRYVVTCEPVGDDVYVDPEMWETIVLNLISNALKFTFEGSIEVSLRADGARVRLEVRDTGTGIAPENITRLFERFHRIEGARARTQEGSGIGLALVDDLVHLHGGTIEVTSEPGSGTTFTVTLQKGTAHLPADQIGTSEVQPGASVRTTAFAEEALRWLPDTADAITGSSRPGPLVDTAPGRGPLVTVPGRVLLAEDNADLREYLTRLLARHWTVQAVVDGSAALAAIEHRVPDVVVTDVMMPGLDGFGLLRALRSNDRTAHIPVIMLSARAGEESRVEGLQQGADDYLVKPFSGRELIARVNAQVTLARNARERALLLERERHARAEADRASRAKDEFLAMLGHELRNPLAPIQTALHLMRLRGDASAERERTVIQRQVDHLTRLVDDLLDVSRIARGKVELKRERVEMASVVAKAIETVSPLLEQRRHVLNVDVPRTGLTTDGDPVRLAQVVSNLLTNAAKYTESGGRISIGVRRDGDDVVLRVRDSGVGIPADLLPRLFDLFVQGTQSLDRSQGGLGIGLTIVRSLVSLHGGSVAAYSDGLGRGSEFEVRLPLAASDAVAVRPGHADGAVVLPAPAGLTVLVVDDNADAAEMLAAALAIAGHQPRIAHDAPAALRLCQEFKPAVALLDIGLPVMDGYELGQRLRRIPGLERLRLIAVTGYGQESDRRQSRAAGFEHHLVKPVTLDVLERVLRENDADRITAAATDREPR